MRQYSLILLLILLGTVLCYADDVGVAEVRLFEEENHTYALEVDISPYLINTIQPPILPERCIFIGSAERVQVGPMLVIRYRFSSGNEPLQEEDDLLLYWQRSGIILTAYWLDGSSKKVFFDRQLAGFKIAVSSLRDVEVTRKKIMLTSGADALINLKGHWFVFLMLSMICALSVSWSRMIKFLLAFAGGHGLSLLTLDLGLPVLPASMSIVMIALATILLFLLQVGSTQGKKRLWTILMVLGLIHGLSYHGPAFEQSIPLTKPDLLSAHLFYNLMIDSVFLLGTCTLYFIVRGLRNWKPLKLIQKGLVYVGGGVAVASLLYFIPVIWTTPQPEEGIQLSGISRGFSQTGKLGTPSGPVAMEDPMMGFVTITPFEIRCEWLIRARDLYPVTVKGESGKELIPLHIQDSLKLGLMKQMASETRIGSDGTILQATRIRADFVSMSSFGVSTRTRPIPEALDQAVVGVTLAYAVSEAPGQVRLELLTLPEQVSTLPISFTDPWGSYASLLSDLQTKVEWKARMAGFRRPLIQPVRIEAMTWPVVSLILILAALGLALMNRNRPSILHGNVFIFTLLGAAILLYPIARVDAPASISRKVRSEETGRMALNLLLTNIYRAFDYQTEEAVYDHLSISTMGNQLSGIYLEHQSAMELEERGGARASVDQVQVLEIEDMKRTKEGIRMDASWVVSGSVSHFGHIHYRKNLYNARIFIKAAEESWKISGIDVNEKERIL